MYNLKMSSVCIMNYVVINIVYIIYAPVTQSSAVEFSLMNYETMN